MPPHSRLFDSGAFAHAPTEFDALVA